MSVVNWSVVAVAVLFGLMPMAILWIQTKKLELEAKQVWSEAATEALKKLEPVDEQTKIERLCDLYARDEISMLELENGIEFELRFPDPDAQP